MKIQGILLASIVALGSVGQAQASTGITMAEILGGASRMLRPATRAIDCVPPHIRVRHEREAIQEMCQRSQSSFFTSEQLGMRRHEVPVADLSKVPFSEIDLKKINSRISARNIDLGKLLQSTTSVNFLSLSEPFSPASAALLANLAEKMKSTDKERKCHIIADFVDKNKMGPDDRHKLAYDTEVSFYLYNQHIRGGGSPIKKSLENILVVLLPMSSRDHFDRLEGLCENLNLPYTIMFMRLVSSEAYWMRKNTDDEGIIAIHEGKLPNQLLVFKQGDLVFSHDFSVSTFDTPGEDIFVWPMIERLHKRTLSAHNPRDANGIVIPKEFPKIKADQWGWEFTAPYYRSGRIKKSTEQQSKAEWVMEYEDNSWNRFKGTYPSLETGTDVLNLKQKQ